MCDFLQIVLICPLRHSRRPRGISALTRQHCLRHRCSTLSKLLEETQPLPGLLPLALPLVRAPQHRRVYLSAVWRDQRLLFMLGTQEHDNVLVPWKPAQRKNSHPYPTAVDSCIGSEGSALQPRACSPPDPTAFFTPFNKWHLLPVSKQNLKALSLLPHVRQPMIIEKSHTGREKHMGSIPAEECVNQL